MIIIVPDACKAIINVLVLPGGRVYCTASLGGIGVGVLTWLSGLRTPSLKCIVSWREDDNIIFFR